ncbi:MAG: DUF2341 domain-containing protein, partial [Dehalococcoidales bacterium]|nr:DUF2341 domain-containing protein [Dehalococcoidales bacterium]
ITKSSNGEKQIIWEVDWRQGETYELAYQFKAPDISPQFYLLGPLAFRQTVKKINLPEEALEDEAATFSQQIDPATQTIADPLLKSSPSALAKELVNVVITEEIIVFQEARRWQLAIDAALTLRPNADGTTTGWTTSGGGSTNLYAEIDDDPDSPTDTDYVQGPNKTDSSMFVELGNTPSDFESAGTVEIKARHQENGSGNDTITIYYQIFQSDESTALTAETAGTTLTEGSWTNNAYSSLSITGTNSKTIWDGAKLRIRQVYAKVAGPDTTSQARISAAEVNLTYTPLSPPSAPTNVSATDGTYTDKVVVSWTKSTGATGYKVYEGSNLLETLGDVDSYDDTTAPAPTITPGTASASDGTYTDYVALSLSGQSANNGASRTYKVVAFNGAGDSPDSDTDNGYRGVGSLTYQWQRSAADSDANYANIEGATTSSYDDYDAPANGDGRYYRCVLNAAGASQQTSTSDRGYRQVPPAQLNQKSYRWRNDDGGEGSSEVWYSQDWDYRKPVAITNSNEVTLENFQVQVSLDTSTLITNNKMESDCADIRFTDSDKKTLINYWIESGCNTTDTKMWVKIPSIPTAGKNIYLYYGNSSASSTADGEAVFDFFDDFLGTSLDTDKWQDFNPESFGSLEVADGLLKISGVSDGSTWKTRGVLTANTFTFPSGGAVIEVNNKWNLANQYSAKEVRITNGVPPGNDSGYQWRFDYSRTGIIDDKKYRFVKNDGGAGTQVTSISISNNSPANFEIERYVWYDVGGQAQVATRSTDGGDSFTSLWNATDSSWSLPASRYLGYTYSNRQTTSGGYAYLDWIRIRKYASSQPGASLGTEESQPTGGGASWKAVENTAVSDIEKNKNIRLRFSINNSGG